MTSITNQRSPSCQWGFVIPESMRQTTASRMRPGMAPSTLAALPKVQLTLLIGQYAQRRYLAKSRKKTLTETVRHWRDYAPDYLPLPHPSWRNNVWIKKNPWFTEEVLTSRRPGIRLIRLRLPALPCQRRRTQNGGRFRELKRAAPNCRAMPPSRTNNPGTAAGGGRSYPAPLTSRRCFFASDLLLVSGQAIQMASRAPRRRRFCYQENPGRGKRYLR